MVVSYNKEALVTLNADYGYVLLALLANLVVHQAYMVLAVGEARKKYNVQPPTLMATGDSKEANMFNCIQRAHQNSLEVQPTHLIVTVLLGLRFPRYAAATSLVVTLGRIIYFRGYSTGTPKKRKQGDIWYAGALAQWFALLYWSVGLLLWARAN